MSNNPSSAAGAPMTEREIAEGLAQAVQALLAKGVAKPDAYVLIHANRVDLAMQVTWQSEKPGAEEWGQEYLHSPGESCTEALVGLLAQIDALPSKQQRQMQKFQEGLGKLIDKGKELGIEVEHLNPLVELSQRLSKNALPAGPKTPAPPNDEIPF